MESRPIHAETQVPSARSPRKPWERLGSLVLAGWMLLGTSLLASLWLERFEPWALVLAVAALATLIYATEWWRTRRLLAATIILDVAMIFLFLWSLDEREHVVIQVIHGQYIGSMGTASVRVGQAMAGGRFGLYAGTLYEFRVTPLGEAPMDAPTTPLARFGAWMRLALAPAWTNVHILAGGHELSNFSHPDIVNGSWAVNRRGEYTGSPYSNVILGAAPAGDYTIEGDLMRGDGTQGIVLGINASNRGDVFEARADVPDVQWVKWDTGVEGNGLGGSVANFPLETMLQRNIRLVLANDLWGIALLIFVLPFYVLLLSLFHRLGGSAEEELVSLEHLLQRPRLMLTIASCVAVAATILTALIASNLLERIPHVQDSVADLFQAKTLALGRLSVPAPRFPNFFTEEFIPMYNGQWFGKYPPGWPLVLAIGVLLHIPWLVDPILSGVIILLIFAIGREVYSAPIGLLAALLTLSSPFFLFLGGSFMPHTATVFYLLSAAYLFVRWYNRSADMGENRRLEITHLIPAGFLLGMGFMTRQTDAIAFALPFTAFLLPSVRRKQFRPAFWLLVGGIPPVAFLLLYNWILTGSPLTSPYSLWWPFDRPGFGPSIGEGGFTPAQGLWNTSFNLQMLLVHLFGWPFYLTLALASLPFTLGRSNRWDWAFLASAGFVIIAYVAYWNPGVMYGPRYYFAAVPGIALLTARGLEELYRWPLRISRGWAPDRIAALAIPAAVLALLVSYNLSVYLPAQIPVYHSYNYTSAASVNAVQRAGIHHALIFVVSTPAYEWWSYGSVFSSNSPLLDGDIVYARDQGSADRTLMRAYPGRSYYRLNSTTLRRLST
jgi:4-amino-4-deoxy-L-arabinose transferase-like glycosyltransferase